MPFLWRAKRRVIVPGDRCHMIIRMSGPRRPGSGHTNPRPIYRPALDKTRTINYFEVGPNARARTTVYENRRRAVRANNIIKNKSESDVYCASNNKFKYSERCCCCCLNRWPQKIWPASLPARSRRKDDGPGHWLYSHSVRSLSDFLFFSINHLESASNRISQKSRQNNNRR